MSTTVTEADVARMSDALFIQRGPKASKFWTLLVLAAVIATARIYLGLHGNRDRRDDRRAPDDTDPGNLPGAGPGSTDTTSHEVSGWSRSAP